MAVAEIAAESIEPGAEQPFVELNGVGKRYGTVMAVSDVSFSVKRGEFLTLLGPSGSGKSTILRMIAGFTEPDHGDIIVNSRHISHTPPHRRSIGVVFQSLALFPHMTVAENVAYPLKCRRHPRGEIPDLVEKYLGIVRLQGLGARRIGELSGGQRQRVAIARALVFEPDLLLLDEPLAALDKKLREEVQMEFRRIQMELGVTTINVTHDQREALVMSDRIMVMEGGCLQQIGTPAHVYRQPSNGFVATFIGQTNVFPFATGRAGSVFGALAQAIEAGGADLPEVRPREPAESALRAERIRIGATRGDLNGVDIVVPATVYSAAYEGDRILYEAVLPETGMMLRVLDSDPVSEFTIGQPVRLGWKLSDMVDLI